MHQCAKVNQRNQVFRKMVDYRQFSDLSIVLDAAGGMATVWHPHFHSHSKNEKQRHELLKVHCMFTKLHGHGVMIFRGVSKLEATGGANFVLECLFRSIIYYLTEKRKLCPNHMIRYLYEILLTILLFPLLINIVLITWSGIYTGKQIMPKPTSA